MIIRLRGSIAGTAGDPGRSPHPRMAMLDHANAKSGKACLSPAWEILPRDGIMLVSHVHREGTALGRCSEVLTQALPQGSCHICRQGSAMGCLRFHYLLVILSDLEVGSLRSEMLSVLNCFSFSLPRKNSGGTASPTLLISHGGRALHIPALSKSREVNHLPQSLLISVALRDKEPRRVRCCYLYKKQAL